MEIMARIRLRVPERFQKTYGKNTVITDEYTLYIQGLLKDVSGILLESRIMPDDKLPQSKIKDSMEATK